MDYKKLQNIIGYKFKDTSLLHQALSHSSYANEKQLGKSACNERLEFLGDAVLELVSSEYLYKASTTMAEGDMTKARAGLVCEPALSFCAKEFHLPEFILLARGEDATGGRYRDSIISDALEALIGAIYLDGGFEQARIFIYRFVLNNPESAQKFSDNKTSLQEIVQQDAEATIVYQLLESTGPDHNKQFKSAVLINHVLMGTGIGKSKKASEQLAAYEAIIKLQGR